MKPNEIKPEIVYRIIDRQTDSFKGSYSRSCCDEYDFESIDRARNSNCHGMHQNKGKYKIAKYKVTYELIDNDCDNAEEIPIEKDIVLTEEEAEGKTFVERMNMLMHKHMNTHITKILVEADSKNNEK
jgi:hypothetical protein